MELESEEFIEYAVLYNQMIEKNLKDLINISNKRNNITDNLDH